MQLGSTLYLPHLSNLRGASLTANSLVVQTSKWNSQKPEKAQQILKIPLIVESTSPLNMPEPENQDSPINGLPNDVIPETMLRNMQSVSPKNAEMEAAELTRDFSNQSLEMSRDFTKSSAELNVSSSSSSPSDNAMETSFPTNKQVGTPKPAKSAEHSSREALEENLNAGLNPSFPSASPPNSDSSVDNEPKTANVAGNPQDFTGDKAGFPQNALPFIFRPQGDSKIGSTVPGDGHTCANCSATKTPLWRRGPNGQVLCNACGLYVKARNIHRPLTLKRNPITKSVPLKNALGSCPGDGRCDGTGGSQSCSKCPSFLNNSRRNRAGNGTTDAGVEMISCQNCGTVNTPLWRRDVQGHVICNACGLYNRVHKDGRPSDLKSTIVKRRRRNRSQSDELRIVMDSPDKGEHSDSSRASSKNSTPRIPSIVPRAMGGPLPNSPVPVYPAIYHLQTQYVQPQHEASQSDQMTQTKTDGDRPAPCCTHSEPSESAGAPEFQVAPPGYPSTAPVHPAHPFSYIPVPGMPLPSLPPGAPFALGQLPPPIHMSFHPYGQPMASISSHPPPLPLVALDNPSAPQSAPQSALAQAPQTSTQGTPAPAQAGSPPEPHPAVPYTQNSPVIPVKPGDPTKCAIPAPLGSENLNKIRVDHFEDDSGDSPLAVLQYLKEASQDTKKEYLLAAQRQLNDKISQFKHRLGVAEHQLGMCENALRTINQEQ